MWDFYNGCSEIKKEIRAGVRLTCKYLVQQCICLCNIDILSSYPSLSTWNKYRKEEWITWIYSLRFMLQQKWWVNNGIRLTCKYVWFSIACAYDISISLSSFPSLLTLKKYKKRGMNNMNICIWCYNNNDGIRLTCKYVCSALHVPMTYWYILSSLPRVSSTWSNKEGDETALTRYVIYNGIRLTCKYIFIWRALALEISYFCHHIPQKKNKKYSSTIENQNNNKLTSVIVKTIKTHTWFISVWDLLTYVLYMNCLKIHFSNDKLL